MKYTEALYNIQYRLSMKAYLTVQPESKKQNKHSSLSFLQFWSDVRKSPQKYFTEFNTEANVYANIIEIL